MTFSCRNLDENQIGANRLRVKNLFSFWRQPHFQCQPLVYRLCQLRQVIHLLSATNLPPEKQQQQQQRIVGLFWKIKWDNVSVEGCKYLVFNSVEYEGWVSSLTGSSLSWLLYGPSPLPFLLRSSEPVFLWLMTRVLVLTSYKFYCEWWTQPWD